MMTGAAREGGLGGAVGAGKRPVVVGGFRRTTDMRRTRLTARNLAF